MATHGRVFYVAKPIKAGTEDFSNSAVVEREPTDFQNTLSIAIPRFKVILRQNRRTGRNRNRRLKLEARNIFVVSINL